MKNKRSKADWKVRVDLAAMFRLTHMMGGNTLITFSAALIVNSLFFMSSSINFDCSL